MMEDKKDKTNSLDKDNINNSNQKFEDGSLHEEKLNDTKTSNISKLQSGQRERLSSSHSFDSQPVSATPDYEGDTRNNRGELFGVNGCTLEVNEALQDPSKQRFSAVSNDDYNKLPTYPLRPSYKDFHANLRPNSKCVVFDSCPDNPYKPAAVPIYQTATFEQPSSIEYGSYDYTRSGNPTRTALEKHMAMMENAHAGFCFTSGMSALSAVTRLLNNGDTLLIGSDIYGGFHRLASRVTSLSGVQIRFVPTWDLEKVRQIVMNDSSIRLLHMETPSNPLMRITDIRALADILHSRNVLLCVDSTMMSPHLQQPLLHGADIVVHSMTKFIGGHSDTMGGIVLVREEDLAQKIAFFQNAEGTGLAPFDAWLFLRGIKTLAIRVDRCQENAEHIATFLLRSRIVKKVNYAGLEPSKKDMLCGAQSAIDYKIHMGQAKGGGSVISFTTGSTNVSRRIIDSLRIFKLTVSFGSCNSLCEMPATLSHASIPADQRTLPEDLIRLSVGIEDVNDLIEDLTQALGIAANVDIPLPPKVDKNVKSMHDTRTEPNLPSSFQTASCTEMLPGNQMDNSFYIIQKKESSSSKNESSTGFRIEKSLMFFSFLSGIAFTFMVTQIRQQHN